MSEEYTESSEQTEVTPDFEESAPQAESSGAETQEAAPEEKQEEPQVPFHEHPRFKELIEERRQFKSELDQYKGALDSLQKQYAEALRSQGPSKQEAKPEPKYKPLIDQIKAVNPEFAEFQQSLLDELESTKQRAALTETLQKRLNDYEEREFQNSATSRIQSLFESNKVPENFRRRYQNEMEAIAFREQSQGKKHTLQDADRIFNAVHKDYSDFLESYKRETLKGYVADKRSDSRQPAPVTGGAAYTPAAQKIAADDELSQIKWLAEGLRAAKKL